MIDFPVNRLSPSDCAAWYGASIATLVFLWELFKWFRSGSRLRLQVSYDMQPVADSGKLEPQQYIVVKAVNVGAQATTVSHLSLTYYSNRLRLLFRRPTQVMIVPSPELATPLPKLLNTGDTWTGGIPQTTELKKMISEGFLVCGLLNNSTGRSEYGHIRRKK